MINNRETKQIWNEYLKEIEENMKNKTIITVESDELREKLINVFSIFNGLEYEKHIKKGLNYEGKEYKAIFYKDDNFQGFLDYEKKLNYQVDESKVIEKIEALKYFYDKLCENVKIKEIFIENDKLEKIYLFLEDILRSDISVKVLTGYNAALECFLDRFFFVKNDKNRLNKLVFINNLGILKYLYSKIADTRNIL